MAGLWKRFSSRPIGKVEARVKAWRRLFSRPIWNEEAGLEAPSEEMAIQEEDLPMPFSFSDLCMATHDFSTQPCQVTLHCKYYEGTLSNPHTAIIIKRIDNFIVFTEKESVPRSWAREICINEVKILSQLNHPNVAKLLGWCHDKAEEVFFVVYDEGTANRFLSYYIQTGESLIWESRYKIAKGIASALLYLHEEQEKSIFLGFLEFEHIMLDSDFNPKLANFCYSGITQPESSNDTDADNQSGSKESDVSQFGYRAIQIACGLKFPNLNELFDLYKERMLWKAADKYLKEEFNREEMETLITVGIWCNQPDRKMRPTIGMVVEVLNFSRILPVLNWAS